MNSNKPAMNSNNHALYFIATKSGFVRIDDSVEPVRLQRVSNIRTATPYTSFEEADDFFRDYCRKHRAGEYYAVLSTAA